MIHPRFESCRDPKILNAVHRFMEDRVMGNRGGGGGSNATSLCDEVLAISCSVSAEKHIKHASGSHQVPGLTIMCLIQSLA